MNLIFLVIEFIWIMNVDLFLFSTALVNVEII
jgi:hypothetical protein